MMNSGLDTSLQITGTSLDDLGIKEYVDPQWEYVDLGSAGKWMKYNLGSTTEEGYGDYYAWGEVDTYYTGSASSPTWKSGKTSGYAWQSYCGSSSFVEWSTIPYDSTTLVLKNDYDVLYQKSGGKFRMPTESELTALCNLTKTWTSVNGVKGRRFTDTNGNSIFIPAAGRFFEGSRYDAGSYCYVWSSSSSSSNSCYGRGFYFYSGAWGIEDVVRCFGYSVRGIKIE